MGINFAKLFCATLTLATILSGTALTSPVKAQSQPTSTPEATSAPASGAAGGMMKPAPRSKITPEQRQKIETLRTQMYGEIQGVLNKDQQTQYTQAVSSGKKPYQALQGLNPKLTPDQTSKIVAIRKSYQAKAKAIRTQQSSSQPAPASTPAK